MKKLLITNVVYGDTYSDIFLRHHLGAMLDDTNLGACAERIEYGIFTDHDSQERIENHPNFMRMRQLGIPIHILRLTWPKKDTDRFNARYGVLGTTFRMSVRLAIDKEMYCSAMVADLVPAKGFLPKVLARIDEGYDSVFMLPLRSAFEAMDQYLSKCDYALDPIELCKLGYANLHPLWVACHWEASQFTKMPFSLLWNSGTGLLARSFSITPIAFTPTEQMMSCRMIDVDVPMLCPNPYWANDWTEAPIIGVEPLQCYYPPFDNHMASAEWVKNWALKALHPTQLPFLQQKLYYPNKETVNDNGFLETISDSAVGSIF